MECSRCCLQPVIHAFTQSNLDKSLGRMKTKEIIAAVNNLKSVFKDLCTKCQALPSKTNKLIEDIKKLWDERFQSLAETAAQDNEQMRPLVEELQQAFQAVCLTCAKVSNDDNPSNHGQTFVSLDSGNCQADSGRAKSTHTDDNIVQSRADWIGLHKAPEVEEQSFGMSPAQNLILKEEGGIHSKSLATTTSILPPEVEDRLRIEFSNFVELDIIDKLLLSCIMSGMNIAEFAKMLWFPYSIVEPKTRKVKAITKQAAHARWMNICKRFPVFMSVAISGSKDNRRSLEKLREFVTNPNGDKENNRFENGKMKLKYRRAEKAAEEAEKLRKEEVKADASQPAPKGKRGRKKKVRVNNEDCLPGIL